MKTIFIGIAGGSASGKTVLCDELRKVYINDVQVISQDSYYYDRSDLWPGH